MEARLTENYVKAFNALSSLLVEYSRKVETLEQELEVERDTRRSLEDRYQLLLQNQKSEA